MKRILIVDDLRDNLSLLRTVLHGHGCTVEEAGHGAEALARARHNPPDFIISDLLMPVMDGYTLLREWKADARLNRIPFVVYTATYTDANDEKLALDLGADAFILKPAESHAFLARLEDVLARRSGREPGRVHTPREEERVLLKEYSEVLVHKLEAKVTAVQAAHDALAALNADLEQRVRARTAELENSNRALQTALASVKELSGLLPICAWCRRVRDDHNYWQSVESYVAQHTKATFSHSICPACVQQHFPNLNPPPP